MKFIWTYVRIFSIGFCPFQDKSHNFLTAHQHLYSLMPKRKNERLDEEKDSEASQSEDENQKETTCGIFC